LPATEVHGRLVSVQSHVCHEQQGTRLPVAEMPPIGEDLGDVRCSHSAIPFVFSGAQ
jgi:hypothetical protein